MKVRIAVKIADLYLVCPLWRSHLAWRRLEAAGDEIITTSSTLHPQSAAAAGDNTIAE